MRFVSEPLTPIGGTISTADLARGEPSLPDGFVWRDREFRVVDVLEMSRSYRYDLGDKYLARHIWRLRMDDGAVWNVYFSRHPMSKRRRSGEARWFLKTVEGESPA